MEMPSLLYLRKQGESLKFGREFTILVSEVWFPCTPDILRTATGMACDTVLAKVNIYRQIIICPRHWLSACMQSWAEFNFAGKPAVVSNESILHEKHLRTQHTAVRWFWSILAGWKLHRIRIWFAFTTNLSMSVIHRRCTRNPLEQIAEHCQFQLVTTGMSQVRLEGY